MRLNGLCLQDFASVEDAMEFAESLIDDSAAMFGFAKETVPHANPLMVKCLYIHSEGKRHEVTNTETKKIEGVTDVTKGKALTDAAEVTGGTSIFDKAEPGSIKLEFPHFSEGQS